MKWRKQRVAPEPLAWKRGAPTLSANTHGLPADFYLPAIAGASTFAGSASSAATIRRVLEVMATLTADAYIDFLDGYYKRGLERFGDDWVFADMNTVLYALAAHLPITSYLEIGVRRGKSLALVATLRPECAMVAFDLWVENYAGMENPGKAFVRRELERVGFRGSVEFVDGDSSRTVPRYFSDHPDQFFDLITVDGDHSTEGARRDLLNVIPRLKIGGALVFDDICSQYHPELGPLWRELTSDEQKFSTYSFTETGFGIGFAIKKQ